LTFRRTGLANYRYLPALDINQTEGGEVQAEFDVMKSERVIVNELVFEEKASWVDSISGMLYFSRTFDDAR